MKKSFRVSFEIDADRMSTVLGLIVSEVDHLKVTDAADGADAVPEPPRRKVRRSAVDILNAPMRRRKPDQAENKAKGESIARSEVGRFVLKEMEKRLSMTSSEMAIVFRKDGRWKPATASPVMSSLRAAGYLSKEDPSPGSPYHFVKPAPAIVRAV